MNHLTGPLRSSGTALPFVPDQIICWTRMQTEAGQPLDAIVARKELERRAGGGLFLWGVGNAPSRLTRVLSRAALPVRTIFSVMKSKPKAIDVAPAAVVLWRAYIDADGVERPLPEACVVTSRADSQNGRKRAHYALMCRSETPLEIERGGRRFDPAAYRNVGDAGGPVGASQVTAMLQQIAPERDDASYEVNMQAHLAADYWVRLADPVLLEVARLAPLDEAAGMSLADWRAFSAELRPAEARRACALL